jgi:outer membrane protein TolC
VEAFASLETHTRDFARNPSQQMVGVRSQVAFVDVSRRAREHAAQEDLLRWTYLKESTEDQARQEVTAAYHTLQGALEQMPWVQQGVVQAKTSLDLFRPLYREGRQSLLDVVKAEDALARMESHRTELLYGVHRGYAHLMRVIGGLDSTALRRIQSELEVHP